MAWERRASEPMLPQRLFASLRFSAANVTGALMTAALTAAAFLVAQQPLMALGMLLQGAGFAWVALVAGAGVPYDRLVLPLVMAGVGVSMVLPTAPTAVLNSVLSGSPSPPPCSPPTGTWDRRRASPPASGPR